LETKNFDWFYNDQLANHLAALHTEASGLEVLIALSSFESEDQDQFARIRELCAEKYKGSIAFERVSFEDLSDAIVDFRAYLPRN
jgi:hypothetical protein